MKVDLGVGNLGRDKTIVESLFTLALIMTKQ